MPIHVFGVINQVGRISRTGRPRRSTKPDVVVRRREGPAPGLADDEPRRPIARAGVDPRPRLRRPRPSRLARLRAAAPSPSARPTLWCSRSAETNPAGRRRRWGVPRSPPVSGRGGPGPGGAGREPRRRRHGSRGGRPSYRARGPAPVRHQGGRERGCGGWQSSDVIAGLLRRRRDGRSGRTGRRPGRARGVRRARAGATGSRRPRPPPRRRGGRASTEVARSAGRAGEFAGPGRATARRRRPPPQPGVRRRRAPGRGRRAARRRRPGRTGQRPTSRPAPLGRVGEHHRRGRGRPCGPPRGNSASMSPNWVGDDLVVQGRA